MTGGALLIFVDGLLAHQGVLSVLIAFCMLVVGLPRAAATGDRSERHQRLRVVTIYLIASAASLGWIAANNQLAKMRANKIIAAVQAYQAERHSYPDKLAALVPRYLAEVPNPRLLGSTTDGFRYRVSDNDASLTYTTFPPFAKSTYLFGPQSWTNSD